jgi:DNA-binding transcriptional MerR regulator
MKTKKSKSAFRTIAEVAEELEVAPHVLRFWEGKFPELQPMKRAGGRRYYRPDDVELIKVIKDFLYDRRYTIEGVQKLFAEKGVKKFLGEEIQKDLFVEIEDNNVKNHNGGDLFSDILTELKESKSEFIKTFSNV